MRIPSIRHPRTRAALSLVTATLAGLTLFSYLRGVESRTARMGPLVRYLVAAEDIGTGHRVTNDSLAWDEMPGNYLPGGMLLEAEAALGRVVRREVAAGEPLLASDLSPAGGGDLSMLLATGERACGLPLERISFPSAVCRSGDQVDILAAGPGGCETVLAGVTVLGVVADAGSQSASPLQQGYGGSGYLLLRVTEREAEDLAAAVAADEMTILLALCPWER
ncbi:MAG: Flp pilus assembly protein CpaB [Candidatus Geothermincolia bacterium]